MNKRAFRACPICENTEVELLNTQKFVLPEGHPLSAGYDVVCCAKCGFVYADTAVTQNEYDLFYAKNSKYEDNKTATGGGETPWDRKRFDETASCISAFLPDREVSILDIGCANGGLLKSFRKLGYTKLFGVDPSPVCVQNVRSSGIDAQIGSLSDPLNFGLYDCIVMSHVLEHVNNLKGILSSIYLSIYPAEDKHKTHIYIEVPDANRYFDFYVSPFHYFDVEHINHFSLVSLKNLFFVSGFVPLAYGHKEIPVNHNQLYPAIWAISNPTNTKASELIHDARLRISIDQYVSRSEQEFDITQILRLVATGEPLIIWGVGSSTTRLLANSPLGRADIVAFVDNNPKYWGTVLASKPVISPAEILGREATIVVTSKLYGPQIMKQIVDDLKCSNRVVTVYR